MLALYRTTCLFLFTSLLLAQPYNKACWSRTSGDHLDKKVFERKTMSFKYNVLSIHNLSMCTCFLHSQRSCTSQQRTGTLKYGQRYALSSKPKTTSTAGDALIHKPTEISDNGKSMPCLYLHMSSEWAIFPLESISGSSG